MLNLSSVLISSGNAESLRKFYAQVFQKPVEQMMGWFLGNIYFVVLEHSEIKGNSKEGTRVMFNLETPDVKGEFERIRGISGTKVVKEPYQMKEWDGWIATLADPDGNYFQLMTPWDSGQN